MRPESEWDLGGTIKHLRSKMGITQETLSEDIVDPSTISRYESGSQMPTRKNFRLLMERLGAKDYSYGDFTDAETFILVQIRKNISNAMKTGNIDKVEDMLDTFLSYTDNNDPDVLQYVGFFMLVFCDEVIARDMRYGYLDKHKICYAYPVLRRTDNGMKEQINELQILLKLTCKWYTSELLAAENPEGRNMTDIFNKVKSGNERMKNAVFTFSEQRILNAIGVNLARSRKFKSALFHFLINSGNVNSYARQNNIALCCAYLGKPELGLSELKKCMHGFIADADMMTVLGLYKTISRIFAHKGCRSDAEKYISMIRTVFDIHREEINMSFEEFMISSDFMQMY